jgi:hypothetical protein
LREFVAHLRADGRFEVAVLSPTDGPLRRDLEANDAAVFIGAIPIDELAAYEEELASTAAWAAGRFDIVMAATLTSFPAIELAERLGLPSLWRIGEAEPLRTVVAWLGGTIDPAIETRADRAFGTASAVLFNSRAGLAIHRRNGAKGDFAVLGSGPDIADAQAYTASTTREGIRRSLGIEQDRRLLVCAGTIWPIKGQATLIAALRHAIARHPNLECVLMGFHEEAYSQAVRRFIERHRLEGSVRLLPYCDDLRPWWRAADAAVCPSETESMPGSVLEAMSSACRFSPAALAVFRRSSKKNRPAGYARPATLRRSSPAWGALPKPGRISFGFSARMPRRSFAPTITGKQRTRAPPISSKPFRAALIRAGSGGRRRPIKKSRWPDGCGNDGSAAGSASCNSIFAIAFVPK